MQSNFKTRLVNFTFCAIIHHATHTPVGMLIIFLNPRFSWRSNNFLSISDSCMMKEEGKKSVSLKCHLEDFYKSLAVPTKHLFLKRNLLEKK